MTRAGKLLAISTVATKHRRIEAFSFVSHETALASASDLL